MDREERLIETPIPLALLRELDEIYPHRCPSLGKSADEIWHYSGKRAVVDFLTTAYEQQQELGDVE